MALNCAAMLQHGIFLLMIGPLLPELMESFAIAETRTGILLAIASVGFMLAPVVAGQVVDRGGVRRACLIGLAVEAAFLLLFSYSPRFWIAVAAIFAANFGAGFIETSANVLPALNPSKNSAHATMNYVHLFFSIGAFVGPLLLGFYLDATSYWRGAVLLIVIPTALLFVAMAATRFPVAKPQAQGGHNIGTNLRLAMNRVTVLGSLTLAAYVGAEIGISSWLVHLLRQTLDFSTVQATIGLSVLWVAILIARYINGAIGNRVSARVLVVTSGMIGGAGALALLAVERIAPVYLILAVVGLSLGGVFPNVMAEVNRRDPDRAGSVTAVMATGAAAGGASIQWLIGFVAEHASLRVAFLIPAALQLLTTVIFSAALAGTGKPESRRRRR